MAMPAATPLSVTRPAPDIISGIGIMPGIATMLCVPTLSCRPAVPTILAVPFLPVVPRAEAASPPPARLALEVSAAVPVPGTAAPPAFGGAGSAWPWVGPPSGAEPAAAWGPAPGSPRRATRRC